MGKTYKEYYKMSEKIYFANLDALRSIAAILVLFAHILSEYLIKYFPDAIWFTNPVTQFFFVNGGFGVQIFFSLSGFLITYLLLSEMKTKGKFNLRNFYIRRVLRIWPVYFIVVGFVFIVYQGIKILLHIDSIIYESPLMSVLFLSNYDLIRILSTEGMYDNGMLALTWSVSVEEQFYLVWPLIFLLAGIHRIKYAIISIISIAVFFMLWGHNDINMLYHHTISNLIFLGAGALLAYLQVYEHKSLKWFINISKRQWTSILLVFIILLIFTKELLFSYSYGYIMYFILSAVFLFFLLLMLTYKVNRPIEFSRATVLLKMAKYTYGLYMYHRIAGFILSVIVYKALKFTPGIYLDLIVVLIQFVLTFIMAYLSYKYMEQPILRYKDKFSVFHK